MSDVLEKKITYLKTTFGIDYMYFNDNFFYRVVNHLRRERVNVSKGIYKTWEDYFIKETNVLKNIPCICDKQELEKFERQMSAERLSELYDSNEGFKISKQQLYSIHEYLFQDVYDWAGEIRSVSMGKQQTVFLEPEKIEIYLTTIFQEANQEIDKIQNEFQFANFLSNLFYRLNYAHPFREGNGRTIREFLRQLVNSIDFDFGSFELDYQNMNPESLAFGLSCNVPMFITSEFQKCLLKKPGKKMSLSI